MAMALNQRIRLPRPRREPTAGLPGLTPTTGGGPMTAPRANKIGAVFLHVTDLRRSSQFYSEILGIPLQELHPDSPIYCPKMEGTADLILDDNRNNIGTERDVRPICIIKSPDAGATLRFMQQKGVPILFTEWHEDKVFLFTFKDPDGNVLMIMQEHTH
jgi:predicted enzyme related to lactoylglutathione lyase